MSQFSVGDKVLRIATYVWNFDEGFMQTDKAYIVSVAEERRIKLEGCDIWYANEGFVLVEKEPQKHIHYDMIVEWAANPSRVVEYYGKFTIVGEANWYDCPHNQPAWNPETRYRFKPKEPERVFPKTSLTDDELMEVYSEGYSTSVESYRDIANAAIKRYILEQEDK